MELINNNFCRCLESIQLRLRYINFDEFNELIESNDRRGAEIFGKLNCRMVCSDRLLNSLYGQWEAMREVWEFGGEDNRS